MNIFTKIKNRIKRVSDNNSGAALITVVVVIAFVSILATTMLYLAAENYKMKAVDARTKENFYQAEELVELLETNLIIDVEKATEEAYTMVASDYVRNVSKETRESAFLKAFGTSFNSKWASHWINTDSATKADQPYDYKKGIEQLFAGATSVTMTDYDYTNVDTTGVIKFTVVYSGHTYDCIINEGSTSASSADFKFVNPFSAHTSIYNSTTKEVEPYIIQNFSITVTDTANDYTSKIKTSFVIMPPSINWDNVTVTGSDAEIDFADCVYYTKWAKQ